MSAKRKAADAAVSPNVVAVAPTSMKDAGVKAATGLDNSKSVGQWMLDTCPEFIDNPPEAQLAEFVEGVQPRYHDIKGSKHYLRVDGQMIECEEGTEGSSVMNVHVAFGYSQQDFGKLRQSDPPLHGVIKKIRDDFAGYKFDAIKAVKSSMQKILNAGKPRERSATKDFVVALKDMFDTYDTRAKNAKARGDATADQVRFRMARDAFMKVYNG